MAGLLQCEHSPDQASNWGDGLSACQGNLPFCMSSLVVSTTVPQTQQRRSHPPAVGLPRVALTCLTAHSCIIPRSPCFLCESPCMRCHQAIRQPRQAHRSPFGLMRTPSSPPLHPSPSIPCTPTPLSCNVRPFVEDGCEAWFPLRMASYLVSFRVGASPRSFPSFHPHLLTRDDLAIILL